MKVFVDTNILVDVFERRQPYYLDSANIIEQGLLGKYTLVISPLTIINTLYIARKSLGGDVVREKIIGILQFCEISPMTTSEMMSVLSMPNKDVEDNLQYCSAESAGCEIIITRNPKDFLGNNIRICLPRDFIIEYFQ